MSGPSTAFDRPIFRVEKLIAGLECSVVDSRARSRHRAPRAS